MGPKFTVFILVLCLYGVTVNRAQIPLTGPLGLRRKIQKIRANNLQLPLAVESAPKMFHEDNAPRGDESDESCRGFA